MTQKIIQISNHLYYQIKQNHPTANIIVLGDVNNVSNINEIKNKFFERYISEFTKSLLQSNNYNTDQHYEFLNHLNQKYLQVKNIHSINELKKLLIQTPYQMEFTSVPQNLLNISKHYSYYWDSNFFTELFNYSFNTIGRGELFFGLLTNLKNGGSSDFICGQNKIELKAKDGRMKGGQGYANTQSVWSDYVEPFLTDNGIRMSALDVNPLINNSENIITIYNKIGTDLFIEFFNQICFRMYINSEKNIPTMNWNNIVGIDLNYVKLLQEFLIYQFNFYKFISGFKYLILSNNEKYVSFETEAEFRNNINMFRFSGWSWKDDRSFTYSVNLK